VANSQSIKSYQGADWPVLKVHRVEYSPPMKLVSVFMDVEDPVNPLADDAALDFATIFAEAGIRGSFCVTGDKCRTLLHRGRRDVIGALSEHCLGLHTDTHSVHPTTMELLEDLEYLAGCEAAAAVESKGASAFQEAFNRRPAFWGGAGNTWSPEIPEALNKIGIPAYAYALTELPDKQLHSFNGSLALPQNVSVSEDSLTGGPDAIQATLDKIECVAAPWAGVFVGHPTRYRFPDYWDYSYYHGRNPAEPCILEPVDNERYEQSKQRMRELVTWIARRFKVVSVDELVEMPMKFRSPTPEESAYFRVATSTNINGAARWPIHRPGLDPANIVSKTMALTETLKVCVPNW
jgi:hypothetical protein